MSTTKKESSVPQKYPVRPGTTNSGKAYEINNISLLALKCCFEELQDFWMASNADGFEELDDVVLFKQRKESDRGVAYLIQLKHQDTVRPLITDMFLKDTGDFSFKRYSKCYNNMQNNIETATENEMLGFLKQNSEMVFIIFTNKRVSIKQMFTDNPATVVDFLIKMHQPSPILDDIGSDGDIFKIHYAALTAKLDINEDFLKNLYLFTNQSHNHGMEEKIKNILKYNLENKLQLPLEDVSDIVSNFVQFIGHWVNGRLGGYYPLTKKQILRKFVELLLCPYMLIIHAEDNDKRDEEEDIEGNEEDTIWYDITEDKDVTVIYDGDDIVERFVRNVTNKICNSDIVNSITHINKTLMRVGSNSKKLLISDKYELLWKSNNTPLILEVSDDEGALYIQKVLNQFPKIYRVIILNKTKFNFQFGDLKLFVNLNDLIEDHQENIFRKPIKFQGREVLSIENMKINKAHYLTTLKVKDVVQILCGQYNVCGQFEDVPKFFVDMSLTANIFHIELLKGSGDIFVVKCGMDNFESVLQKHGIDAIKIIRWDTLINKDDFNGQIITFNDIQNLGKIEAFCLKLTKPVHFLTWHDGDYMDLIKSNNIENLKKHKRNSTKSVLAKDLLQNFYKNRQTVIVSAIPGMGKSVLMKYFALKLPIKFWVLDIPLAKYQDHYKNLEGQNSVSQLNFEHFLKEVVKAQQTPNDAIFNSVFEQYLNCKNVVFLLDGLDEVAVDLQNGAIQLIKYINQLGYCTCVTTRPLLQEKLESTLNTFAISLNMFTMKEQTSFLTKYFANAGKVDENDVKLEEFVSKLLKATKSNLNDFDHQFTGVPLQTTLLAEVFEKDYLKFQHERKFKNQIFDLIYLYQHFIDKKLKIACEKAEKVSEAVINCFKDCRSLYGLRHIFADQDLEELQIDGMISGMKKWVPHALQQIQKDGITVINGDSSVTFVHQTYAEYLAANWLAENINTQYKETVGKLVIKCFNPHFVVVRNIFDRILAKKSELHSAIINRQFDKINTLILNEDAFSRTDDGGRTILHLLSSWRTPDPNNSWSTSNSEKRIKQVLNKCNNNLRQVEDELLHYTPLDYAIASRSLYVADGLALAIENPSCNIKISKGKIDDMLQRVKQDYSFSLYIIILKCLIRTVSTEQETCDLYTSIINGDLDRVTSQISEQNVDALFDGRCTPLHVATKGGHMITVQSLLTNKADVKKRDDNGRSALHWASYIGHLEIMSMLLCKGAQLIATDCYDLTPYHYAVLSSLDDPTIKNVMDTLLTSSKSRLNATGKIAKIKHPYVHPLHLAAHFGQGEVLNSILTKSHKVDPNIKGWKGMTALMLAAQNNQINSLMILLSNNAAIDATDHRNQTALHYAASEGCQDIVTILLDRDAAIDAKNSDGETPLHLAAKNGHEHMVTTLLTKAVIDAKDHTERTALHCAAEEGHEKVVTTLLSKGASPNARSENQETPLHLAAKNGHEDIVTILVTNSAETDAQDDRSRTALHYAAESGHEKVVTILLDYNPEIDAGDSMDQTVLHLAVVNGHKDVVATVFLKNNPNMEAEDSNGETPRDIAFRKGYNDIITLLNEAQG